MWIHQINNFGLGNFIAMTGALRQKSWLDESPVKVYFDNREIADCYQDCQFIEVLSEKPATKPAYTTAAPTRNDGESDYEAWGRILSLNKILDPYIDRPNACLIDMDAHPCMAIFCGCAGAHWLEKKRISARVLTAIIKESIGSGLNVYLLGNESDNGNFWMPVKRNKCIDLIGQLSLRDTLSVLARCDFFISNDTGLYHAAAALKINGLVMWNKTPFAKNRAPFNGIRHVHGNDQDDDLFIREAKQFISGMKQLCA